MRMIIELYILNKLIKILYENKNKKKTIAQDKQIKIHKNDVVKKN